MDLLHADSFVNDAHGRMAMLEVLARILDELEATAPIVCWIGPKNAMRVIRCMYGHFANESFRVSFWGLLLAFFLRFGYTRAFVLLVACCFSYTTL